MTRLTYLPDSPWVLFENLTAEGKMQGACLFENPVQVIACFSLDRVGEALDRCEAALQSGYYLAGFLAYEAAYAFEPVRASRQSYPFPLVWFGVFKGPEDAERYRLLKRNIQWRQPYQVRNLRLDLSTREYARSVRRIKNYIEAGDVYQVNFTLKYLFSFKGSALALYEDLKKKQPVNYAAILRTKSFSVLSLSPELFFQKSKNRVLVKPMKGTIRRGLTLDEDRVMQRRLQRDAKSRAENLMIVDLLRNDLGRIASAGSVRPLRLFDVERYATLHQMTSSIQATLPDSVGWRAVLKALFPSGSVTGAPKIRTMQIIQEIEKRPRGIYTGALGFVSPQGDALFSVGIRTLSLRGNQSEMGVGSGIVYDSNVEDEYRECQLKGRFLYDKAVCFQLVETLLWMEGRGYFLLAGHLQRLQDSARYFCFPFDVTRVRKALWRERKSFQKGHRYRVRLRLFRHGSVHVAAGVLDSTPSRWKACIAVRRVDSGDVFLRHKTTHRLLYEQEYKRCRQKGYDEVLFLNEKGHLTEGSRSNLFIQQGKSLYTPPLSDGVLAGVYRDYFLKTSKRPIQVRSLTLSDLKRADAVFLTNAVRGGVRGDVVF